MKAKQEKQLVKQFALQLTEEKAKQKEVSKIYSNKKKSWNTMVSQAFDMYDFSLTGKEKAERRQLKTASRERT